MHNKFSICFVWVSPSTYCAKYILAIESFDLYTTFQFFLIASFDTFIDPNMGLHFEKALSHKIFTDIIRAVYPSICHFKFCDRVFGQSRNFYENKMIKLDPAKSGLESGAWIDEYDYQNRKKKALYTNEK